MDSHQNQQPYLVEIDNIGEANSSPSQYTLIWWLKQILEASGGGVVKTPVDVKSADWVSIDDSTYFDLCIYQPSSPEIFNLQSACISLRGFNAEFLIESSFDGVTIERVRSYNLNTQQSSLNVTFSQPIIIPLDGVNGYIKIKSKMNYQNQLGIASGALNGFV